jgi:ADP-heptose:LPS heptosyltransferase
VDHNLFPSRSTPSLLDNLHPPHFMKGTASIDSDPNPRVLARDFLEALIGGGVYRRDLIALIVDAATDRDPELVYEASRALFAGLIEPLADSFEPSSAGACNRVLAQLAHHCRGKPGAEDFDRRLRDFGLDTEESLLERVEGLTREGLAPRPLTLAEGPARIIVLSRVTLGADVAITSVIVERLKLRYPSAEIVFAGGRKLPELFGGDSRLRFAYLDYQRGGRALDRLLNWLDLLDCVGDLTRDLEDRPWLVVDPDTRLTQLGLLPVCASNGSCTTDTIHGVHAHPRAGYVFFPSRVYGTGTSTSLGELASEWIDGVFGSNEEATFPRLHLSAADVETARAIARRISEGKKHPIVALNFGFGDNPAKRVGDEFETGVVERLMLSGAKIILDSGAGEEEARIVDRVVASAASRTGSRTIGLIEDAIPSLIAGATIEADLLVWSGRIGMLAALIGESDLFIGYDSAGQHIAAALGTPCVDVFAGFRSPRMVDRWTPRGRGEVRVVRVDANDGNASPETVLNQVLSHARALLTR